MDSLKSILSENINIIALIATVTTILATYFGYISIKWSKKSFLLSQEIAKAQGSYKKTNLHAQFFKNEIVSKLYLGFPFSSDEIFTCTFPFRIINSGEIAATSIIFSLQVPDVIFPIESKINFNQSDRYESGGMKISYKKANQSVNEMLVQINKLGPYNTAADLELSFLFTHPTILDNKLTTEDGTINFDIKYNYTLDYTLYHEEAPPQSGRILVEILNNSEEHIISQIIKAQRKKNLDYKKKVKNKEIVNPSFFQYYFLKIKPKNVPKINSHLIGNVEKSQTVKKSSKKVNGKLINVYDVTSISLIPAVASDSGAFFLNNKNGTLTYPFEFDERFKDTLPSK